jgi:hypothetical protein
LDRLKREIGNALHGVWQIPTILPLTTTMPSDRKQVVVLYAETKLQKSIDLPGSATAANAKASTKVSPACKAGCCLVWLTNPERNADASVNSHIA